MEFLEHYLLAFMSDTTVCSSALATSAPTIPTKSPINPVRSPIQDDQLNRWRDWVVRLFNDPFNKFEYVVECLVKRVPGMSADMAWSVAWQAHADGVAAAYQGPQEVAEMVCEALQRDGLTSDCSES